ncbi:hypothetical protein XM25_15330 [Devosia sp. H5989]|nr:hypothetical protein XM25_15330 [Devosia sp. H5989]
MNINANTLLTLMLVVLAVFMIASGIYGRWPDANTMLLGSYVGLLPLAVAITTLTAIIFGARNAALALDQARRAEASGRFQKGAEMLASHHGATRYGGLVLLLELAQSQPTIYLKPARDVLIHFSADEGEKLASSLRSSKPAAYLFKDESLWPDTNQIAIIALVSALNLSRRGIDAGVFSPEERVSVGSWGTARFNLNDADFSNVRSPLAFITKTSVTNCRFSKSDMNFVVGKMVTFKACDFSGAKVLFYGNDFAPLTHDTITFIDCTFEGTKINGVPASEWLGLAT